jgi:endonuclease/exonuclease/phosphatase family metal-dependent hydrolase
MKCFRSAILPAFIWLLAMLPLQAQNARIQAEIIAFYNVENLFDTVRDQRINDVEFTPWGNYKWNTEKYLLKLHNMARVLADIGTDLVPVGPAIIGLAEVENRGVLEDLVRTPPLDKRPLGIVHYDSPDARGIDVAMLYDSTRFRYTGSRAVNPGIQANDNPDFRTRDILLVEGLLNGEQVYILVNHWPSRRGGEKRSRPLRMQAAQANRAIIDSLLAINPNARIVVMGDFNDDPINKSMTAGLKSTGDLARAKSGVLFNPFLDHYRKGLGTLGYQDSWNLFDMVLLSPGWMQPTDGGYEYLRAVVFRRPYLIQEEGRFKGYPYRTHSFGEFIGGYSDHLPVYVVVGRRY